MSIAIDRKFLLFISPKLERFAQKKADLYNFRCPICGDSQKHKHKARGYIYKKKNDYYYKCQNCGIGHTFYNFLNFVDPSLVKEYSLERYKDNGHKNQNSPAPKAKDFSFTKPVFKKTETIKNLESIESLSDIHYAKQYVIGRKIPQSAWKHLYYAEDFKKFIDYLVPNHEKQLKEDDPRLVIPFFDNEGNITAVQGRALKDSKIRYITIKIAEENIKLFGMNTVDSTKKIYVTEGPIDSLFLANAVATADANLSNAGNYYDKENLVLVFDNEPRNKELLKIVEKSIKEGYNVCIWPHLEYKDINEMILSGMTQTEIQGIIDSNTFSGLRANMEFINWKVAA